VNGPSVPAAGGAHAAGPAPLHTTDPVSPTSTVRDGRLYFDDVDVADLAERVPTPFFLFSGRRVDENVRRLTDAFCSRHRPTEVFYAGKACSLRWFLERVHAAGGNAEVNSGGELWKGLESGFQPEQIVFNGAAKTGQEIAEAVRAGIRAIVVDSVCELERVAAEAGRQHCRPAVALRVDVDVATSTHPGLVTAHGGKAGIDRSQALDAFRFAAGDERLHLAGLHMHIGSQITSPEPYVAAMAAALDLIDVVEAECGVRLEHLNAGGGFPVPYKRLEVTPPDPADFFRTTHALEEYAEVVCGALQRRRPDLRLFLEPGRAIAADTAVLVTRVENEKTKVLRDEHGAALGEERWLAVDAGYNVLTMARAYSWFYPTVVAGRADEPCTELVRLAGPLCDGGDVFPGDDESGLRRVPAGTTLGDLVVFQNVGAYALDSGSRYNARPLAAAHAVEDGAVRLVRRADTYADLFAHDVAGVSPARP
jgi:D-ornithine/D-lysine decarboxylase